MSDESIRITEEDIIRTRKEQGLELSDEEKEQYRTRVLAVLKNINKQLGGATGIMMSELRASFDLEEWESVGIGINQMIQKLEKQT